MMTSSSITPPVSPNRSELNKENTVLCQSLPNCRGFKQQNGNSANIQWFSGDFIATLLSSNTDLPKLLRSYNTPILARRCESLEYGKCRLNQLLNVFSTISERPFDVEALKVEFNEAVVTFCINLVECFSRSHFDEVGNAIDSVLRYAGKLNAQPCFIAYDSRETGSSSFIHVHLELRYYLLAFFLWTATKSPPKDWWKVSLIAQQKQQICSPCDIFVLSVLFDIFQVKQEVYDNLCICFVEFRAVFLYFLALSPSAVDIFFEWLKQQYKPDQLAEFLLSSVSGGTLFPPCDFVTQEHGDFHQPFYAKCLQLLLATCFTSSGVGCLTAGLATVSKLLLDLLNSVDDASIRTIWDFFASNLNKFSVPKFLHYLMIGSESASSPNNVNGDLVDYFNSISEKSEKNCNSLQDPNSNELTFPLVSFVELVIRIFSSPKFLPTENDRRRIWRKLKGGLFKRFYEAALRRLNDDGWQNAAFMLTASAFIASGHSSEDLFLVGEILQRVSFLELSQTGQLSIMTSLFSLLKLNLRWSPEFHPAQCARDFMNNLLASNNSAANLHALVIHYFRCVEVFLSNIAQPNILEHHTVDLLNLVVFPKVFLNEMAKSHNIDFEFIHKLMDVISAILLSVRQLVLSVGDSQGSSNSIDDQSHQNALLLSDANSPLCRLVIHVNSSLYPIVSVCEQAIQKNQDVSIDRFVSLVRGFLLLSLDVAHLPIASKLLVRSQDLISAYYSNPNQKIAITFLADCLNNARISSLLLTMEVVTPTQCLAFYFRLTLRLLLTLETSSSSPKTSQVPDLSVYLRFQDCCLRCGKLRCGNSRSAVTTSLTPAFLLDSLTDFLNELGNSGSSEAASILESFLTFTEDAFKPGFDSSVVAKCLFRLSGSLFCYCAPLLYKPFRPDCYLNKAIMLYLYRVSGARKNLPPSYVISSLHKWTLPGILIGIGRLIEKEALDDPNLRRYVTDCVVESLVRGQSRPNYTLQTLEMHPLVASGVLGRTNSASKLEPVIKPISPESDGFGSLRKIVTSKLVSDCVDSSFANWQLAAGLLEFHLSTSSWTGGTLETTLVVALPRLLDLCCAYQERRLEVQGYLEAIDRLFRSVSSQMTTHQLWESCSILSAVGDFVDRTATAHPKLTFSALTRFLLACSQSSPRSSFLMAIRTAVVRMELDYGNGDFIRPHFEAFETQFSHLT